MGVAVKRQRVVLAESIEGDRPLDDLPGRRGRVSRLGRERRHELLVALVAGGRVEQGLEEAPRRLPRAGSVGRHAEGREDLGDVRLVALPVDG